MDDIGVTEKYLSTDRSTCRSEAKACGNVPHGQSTDVPVNQTVTLSCNKLIWAPNPNVWYYETLESESEVFKRIIRSAPSTGQYFTRHICNDGTLVATTDNRSIEERFAPSAGQARCTAPAECSPKNINQTIDVSGTSATLTAWSHRYGQVGEEFSGFGSTGSYANGVLSNDYRLYTVNFVCRSDANGQANWAIKDYAPWVLNWNWGFGFNFGI